MAVIPKQDTPSPAVNLSIDWEEDWVIQENQNPTHLCCCRNSRKPISKQEALQDERGPWFQTLDENGGER